jgi:hypothetical protein
VVAFVGIGRIERLGLEHEGYAAVVEPGEDRGQLLVIEEVPDLPRMELEHVDASGSGAPRGVGSEELEEVLGPIRQGQVGAGRHRGDGPEQDQWILGEVEGDGRFRGRFCPYRRRGLARRGFRGRLVGLGARRLGALPRRAGSRNDGDGTQHCHDHPGLRRRHAVTLGVPLDAPRPPSDSQRPSA